MHLMMQQTRRLLLVTLIDRVSHEYATTFEASSRLGERLKLTVEASVIDNARNVPTGFQGPC